MDVPANYPMNMKLTILSKRSFTDWIGGALALLGVTELLAAMTGFVPESGAFSLSSVAALCFILSGGALLAQSYESHRRWLQSAFGAVLLLLAGSGFAQNLFQIFLHKKVFLSVSELPLDAAIAFIFAGLILVLIQDIRVKWLGSLLQLFSVALMLIGFLGLIDYIYELNAFLSWYQFQDISMVSACATGLLGVGFYVLIRRMPWYVKLGLNGEDRKITVISGLLLSAIALSGGLVVATMMAQQTEEVLKNSLATILDSRIQVVHGEINDAIEDAVNTSNRIHLRAALSRISKGADTAEDYKEMEAVLNRLHKVKGIPAVAVYDVNGRKLGQRGEFIDSEFKVSLPSNNRSTSKKFSAESKVTLLWHNGFILNVKQDAIDDAGKRIGIVNIDEPLPDIDALYKNLKGLGRTGSMAICTAYDSQYVLCPPVTKPGQTNWQFPHYIRGKASAIGMAVNGKTGVVSMIGQRGQELVAAYAPIDANLGMIVKMDQVEMYQPVHTLFERTLLLLFIIITVGIILLRWQVAPLVSKLINEISERKRAEERLNYMAHYDELTGLPNRILFNHRLKQAMMEAAARERLVALMFVDLDRFKTINDTLGYEIGDVLLKAVAERLKDCLRRGDTVARLSGDEFALVFADMAHIDDASRLAQKILDSFTTPFRIGERDLFITSSIGITLYPFDQDDANTLLKNADAAMYRAKEQGRNNYQFYTSEMNVRALERLSFETNLRQALERDEFILHYQPKVDLVTGNVIGMEALLRWQNPELGLVSPTEFIPLAEETGLIVAIGEWVIRTACKQNKAWQAAGLPSLRISVNLSARQFKEKNLVERVAQALKETGLEARYLELELTESLLQTPETTITPLKELHALGIHLSIDDFGTGYSSLSYLKRFPIDTLKIDRSFVRDITTDADDAAIANAIITMAHSLGMYVVAEGVETGEQLAFLCQRKCDSMQGYYFSKPLPADVFASLIKDRRRLTPSQRRISAEMKVMSA